MYFRDFQKSCRMGRSSFCTSTLGNGTHIDFGYAKESWKVSQERYYRITNLASPRDV